MGDKQREFEKSTDSSNYGKYNDNKDISSVPINKIANNSVEYNGLAWWENSSNRKWRCGKENSVGNFVEGWRVRDGIVDCCDGSDEDLSKFYENDKKLALNLTQNVKNQDKKTTKQCKEYLQEIVNEKKELVEKFNEAKRDIVPYQSEQHKLNINIPSLHHLILSTQAKIEDDLITTLGNIKKQIEHVKNLSKLQNEPPTSKNEKETKKVEEEEDLQKEENEKIINKEMENENELVIKPIEKINNKQLNDELYYFLLQYNKIVDYQYRRYKFDKDETNNLNQFWKRLRNIAYQNQKGEESIKGKRNDQKGRRKVVINNQRKNIIEFSFIKLEKYLINKKGSNNSSFHSSLYQKIKDSLINVDIEYEIQQKEKRGRRNEYIDDYEYYKIINQFGYGNQRMNIEYGLIDEVQMEKIQQIKIQQQENDQFKLDLLDVEENEMDKEKEMRRKNKYNSKGYKDDDDDDDEDVFDEWIKSKLENIIEEDVQTNIQTVYQYIRLYSYKSLQSTKKFLFKYLFNKRRYINFFYKLFINVIIKPINRSVTYIVRKWGKLILIDGEMMIKRIASWWKRNWLIVQKENLFTSSNKQLNEQELQDQNEELMNFLSKNVNNLIKNEEKNKEKINQELKKSEKIINYIQKEEEDKNRLGNINQYQDSVKSCLTEYVGTSFMWEDSHLQAQLNLLQTASVFKREFGQKHYSSVFKDSEFKQIDIQLRGEKSQNSSQIIPYNIRESRMYFETGKGELMSRKSFLLQMYCGINKLALISANEEEKRFKLDQKQRKNAGKYNDDEEERKQVKYLKQWLKEVNNSQTDNNTNNNSFSNESIFSIQSTLHQQTDSYNLKKNKLKIRPTFGHISQNSESGYIAELFHPCLCHPNTQLSAENGLRMFLYGNEQQEIGSIKDISPKQIVGQQKLMRNQNEQTKQVKENDQKDRNTTFRTGINHRSMRNANEQYLYSLNGKE